MALDASNSQFGAEVEYKVLDRGTPAWAVKPGPDAVDPIPLVPGSTVFSEDFEGPLWTQVFFVSGDWAVTNVDSHSPTNSFQSRTYDGSGTPFISEFTINDFSFSPQLSFWYRMRGVGGGPSNDRFQVLFDNVVVFEVVGTGITTPWTRVAIPTNFAFNITFRWRQESIITTPFVRVDDIVFGSLDTPGVPGAPAHPLIYTPLYLDDNDNLRVTVVDGSVSVTGVVDTRPLSCETDSVTVCLEDPVVVTGVVETRPLTCETDSVSVCFDDPLSITGIVQVEGEVSVTGEVNTRPLTCETDAITACINEPISITGTVDVNVVNEPLDVSVLGTVSFVPGRRSLRGLYYASSGAVAYTSAADGATGGDIWIVNTSPTVVAYIREVRFTSNIAALALLTALPRIQMERMTFTGAPSGPQITPARRDSADLANTATVRTTNAGMVISTGAIIKSFAPPSSDVVGGLLAANASSSVPVEQIFVGDIDSFIVLRQNQGVVFRQATAGSLTENRQYNVDFIWEEI